MTKHYPTKQGEYTPSSNTTDVVSSAEPGRNIDLDNMSKEREKNKLIDLMKDHKALKEKYKEMKKALADTEMMKIVYKSRCELLMGRLIDVFATELYPEFEHEINFLTMIDATFAKVKSAQLDMLVIHHDHYFPADEPVGLAHQMCNILTCEKGMPKAHIFVHGMTKYDSNFMLKMIPSNVMGRKGRNMAS